ncbi:MAG: PQQ-dependent sugar dehydrogenase [Chloroflexi bacterium]|nr:PQQ-dependent sugar dehydrogenase [Chloroflexota bacterium]
MKIIARVMTAGLFVFAISSCNSSAAPTASEIKLPTGFRATIFASGLNRPTALAFGPSNRLYVGQQNGDIVALKDDNGQGTDAKTIAQVGGSLLGLAFRPNARELFASVTGKVIMLRQSDDIRFADPTIIANGLPTGRHQNDQIAFTPDGNFFFIGIGSTCDACIENDSRSATIMQISADGKTQQVYARGLRNPFGLALNPQTNELFATDNGRDDPGSGVPDELNVITQNGNYGWPACWGSGQGSNCSGTIFPIAELQEHSSADGFAFYSGTNFPSEYRGNVFVALWGGNFPIPTIGKRVDRIVLNQVGNKWQGTVSEFASGFDHPLAVAINPRDGALLIADHGSGKIYRIVWVGQ